MNKSADPLRLVLGTPPQIQRTLIPSGSLVAVIHCLWHGLCRSLGLGLPAAGCDHVECYTLCRCGNCKLRQPNADNFSHYLCCGEQQRTSESGRYFCQCFWPNLWICKTNLPYRHYALCPPLNFASIAWKILLPGHIFHTGIKQSSRRDGGYSRGSGTFNTK